MYLSKFVVTGSFRAWAPSDRDQIEKRISVLPGPRHLFTDDADSTGVFVKFLKNGVWYEAERADFMRSTRLLTKERVKASAAH
jgi:hypothetical protein